MWTVGSIALWRVQEVDRIAKGCWAISRYFWTPWRSEVFKQHFLISCTVPGVIGNMSGVIKKNGSVTTNTRNTSLVHFHSVSSFLSYSNGIIWIILFSLIRAPQKYNLIRLFLYHSLKEWILTWWKEKISNRNTSKMEYLWTWLF